MPKNEDKSALPFVPKTKSLVTLRRASKLCRGCDLYKHATQTVFGRGKPTAQLFIVGEQPGSSEDIAGEPFVGPAGKLLGRALSEVGLQSHDYYVTNAVKHFKFVVRGKNRVHQKPKITEIRACKPWLRAELEALQPKLILCLGKTAAESVLGRSVMVLKERGKATLLDARWTVIPTIHPSSLLRMPSHEERERAYRAFVKDLRTAVRILSRN
ncbi:MAG: UdgX family uracil-DNA binding protein [Bdellovibrionota bacterium]